jgi:phosphoenolpyruvate carboxylase
MSDQPLLSRFQEYVAARYQIYNSMFMTLPFSGVEKTGVLLPLFHETCKLGFEAGDDPTTIIHRFFEKYQSRRDEKDQINLLFEFIQYIERQVVLFDAIEDAAFPIIHRMEGIGTLRSLQESITAGHKTAMLKKYLAGSKVRIVLTAHPTQFYPGPVLGIITDLKEAIKNNELTQIHDLLAQLGKTPFLHHDKPTPFDEAVSLLWYLENVFYPAIGAILDDLQESLYEGEDFNPDMINIGFWPGGDRDGNPFVKPETTLQVARRLKQTILRCYYADLRKLRRRLTFRGVEEKVQLLEKEIYEFSIDPEKPEAITCDQFLADLRTIRDIIVQQHQSLYVREVKSLINKVALFRFHFASLDIRQDSRQHERVFLDLVQSAINSGSAMFPADFEQLDDEKQIHLLAKLSGSLDINALSDPFSKETLQTMQVMLDIQASGGEQACNRYIISNTQSTLQIMQLFAMLKTAAFKDKLTVDIVPLFETVDDLEHARGIMEELYSQPEYRAHLATRHNRQSVMVGFSDGTKDGGYLMANWAIYRAKEYITELSHRYGVTVIFFDGRGGPPARGGGKTHRFYASLGPTIEAKEIQLTIQGQTISTNFGTLDSARYNLEQLLSASVLNKLNDTRLLMSDSDKAIFDVLARISYEAYEKFKGHPKFLPYLEQMSTLNYYARTNIGSRPAKRGNSNELVFSDLRAIPFVGSWSQLKQNVPGFYGVGTALKYFEEQKAFDKVKDLYDHSAFFRALLGNSMMSLTKSFFELTHYMAKDDEFGDFWRLIHGEYELTKRLILKLTGYHDLMEDEPASRESIRMRESIVLPLLTIQQYALMKIREMRKKGMQEGTLLEVYEKLVIRSLFGNINASRNSA